MSRPIKLRQKSESESEAAPAVEVKEKPQANPALEADGNRRVADEREFSFEEEDVDESDDQDDPASLAEQRADDRYEEIKKGEIHIAELQKMTMQQLLAQARKEG